MEQDAAPAGMGFATDAAGRLSQDPPAGITTGCHMMTLKAAG